MCDMYYLNALQWRTEIDIYVQAMSTLDRKFICTNCKNLLACSMLNLNFDIIIGNMLKGTVALTISFIT